MSVVVVVVVVVESLEAAAIRGARRSVLSRRSALICSSSLSCTALNCSARVVRSRCVL